MAALSRAFLRHDPDVLLIGEIRDQDTAQTASKAACTGHLVLSTLHTPDAVGGIQRLKGLGLADDEISHGLLGVLAQRLLRKACRHCAQPKAITEHQQQVLGYLLDGIHNVQGLGCNECNGTGYRGRIGVYEFVLVDETLQNMIFSSCSANALRQVAREQGYLSMLEDALLKVNRGIVSLDEVFRVIPYRQLTATATELGAAKKQ